MNEANITNQIVSALRAAKVGQVFKHCDRVTRGIPDISVTGSGGVYWLEVKLEHERALSRRVIDNYQIAVALGLERPPHARCRFVIFFKRPNRSDYAMKLLTPGEMLAFSQKKWRPPRELCFQSLGELCCSLLIEITAHLTETIHEN